MTHSLQDKVILVVGASSGIGEAAAAWLAALGAKVMLVARRDDKLASVVERINASGGKAAAVCGDVTKAETHGAIIRETLNIFDRLDAAFNNAGTIGNFSPLLDQGEADLDHTMATNFKSIWLSVQAQARHFKENGGGAIVNTSSWLAVGGLIGSTTYSASKGALDAFIRPAALELSQYGIRINNVNPGGIDTEMTRLAFNHNADTLRAFGQSHPRGKLGTSQEVAKVVGFLLSDDAANISGQSILVDGAYSIPGQRA